MAYSRCGNELSRDDENGKEIIPSPLEGIAGALCAHPAGARP